MTSRYRKDTDEGACKFEECITLASGDGYCPRHSFLVGQVGYDKTVVIERGCACAECNKRVKDEPKDCPHCEQTRCVACATERKCCMRRIREIEEEADRIEDEADQIRNQAEDIRSSLTEIHREKLEAA